MFISQSKRIFAICCPNCINTMARQMEEMIGGRIFKFWNNCDIKTVYHMLLFLAETRIIASSELCLILPYFLLKS